MTTHPSLQFLADESCDFRVVRALRNAGYDVVAVSEFAHHTVDRDLIEQSARTGGFVVVQPGMFRFRKPPSGR